MTLSSYILPTIARKNVSRGFSLGLVADGKRSVTPVPKHLLSLVPKPKNKTIEIVSDGTDPEHDTVPLMKKKIRKCVHQVEKLAAKLKGSSVESSVRNDWNFIFDHIQYVEDPKNIEAVRDPARTIHDGKGDCDCFTVCLGSMLQAQRIPYKIRVAAYETPGEWSHVYIVVPDKGKEIIVDPVLHKFNHEASYIDKKDFDMKLVSLEGPADQPAAANVCISSQDQHKKLRKYINTQEVYKWGYVATQPFLEENNIPYHQMPHTETESTEFVINTRVGEMQLPTIITQDMADKIKDLFGALPTHAAAVVDPKNKNWLWWVLGGLAAVLLLSGDKKKTAGPALSGIPALQGKKKKRQAKKLETLEL